MAYLFVTHNLNLATTVEHDQAYCFAVNLYHEARGESITGQIAVGSVVLSRMYDDRFPATACDVVHAKGLNKETETVQCQFSWHCDDIDDNITFNNVIEETAFRQIATVSLLMLGGVLADNTAGSTHYYNHTMVCPIWATAYTPTVIIGSHTFLRREKSSLI